MCFRMSGDLQVRKRKGKARKKEEVIVEAPASRNGSSSSSSSFMTSVPISPQPVIGSSDMTRPEKSGIEEKTDNAGSGCLAKMLFAFLVSTLLVLAGLIYVHLHAGNSTPLVIESSNISPDSAIRNAPVISPSGEKVNIELASSTSKREPEVDLESIEEQIVSEEVMKQLSREEMVEEVVVNIPDTDAPATEPVDEPPFVKELVTMLGDKHGKKQETEKTQESDSDIQVEENLVNDIKVEEVEESKVDAVANSEALQEPVEDVQKDKDDFTIKDQPTSMQNEEESSSVVNDSISHPQESESIHSPPTNSEEITTGKDLEDEAHSSPSPPTSDAKQQGSSSNDGTPDAVTSIDKKETKQALGKKRRGRSPPSPEELLPHRNSIERSERLMEAILELSPLHPIVPELRPHLDGAKRDLAEHKLQGLEDTTKHVLLILEDVYVRLADEKEHGPSTTESLPVTDQVNDGAADVPAAEVLVSAESSSSPSSDGPPAESNEAVKRSPPVADAAPPKTSSESTPPAASSPSKVSEVKNAPLKQSESILEESTAPPSAQSKPQQKETRVGLAPEQSGLGKFSEPSIPTARPQESAPRELPASNGEGVGLDDLTEEDLVTAVDTEDLTEKMRAAEQLRQEGT